MTRKPECVWDLIAEAVHLRLPLEDIRATSQPGLQLGMEGGEVATLAGIQEGLEGMSLGEAVLDFIGSMFHSPAPERSILLLDRKRRLIRIWRTESDEDRCLFGYFPESSRRGRMWCCLFVRTPGDLPLLELAERYRLTWL